MLLLSFIAGGCGPRLLIVEIDLQPQLRIQNDLAPTAPAPDFYRGREVRDSPAAMT